MSATDRSASGLEGDLPENWVWAELGQLADYINGRAFKSTEWEETGRPIVRIQNLTGSGSIVNRYSGPVEEKHIIENGDFLISWSATLGTYIYHGEQAVLNQHIFKVEPRIDKLYLYYLITSYLHDLEQKVHGSGMQHITKSKFEESVVPLAPLNEQQRIVRAVETQFTRLDAAVDAVERAHANLERYRASVLQTACEGRLVPTEAELARQEGRDYEPADQLLERILKERRARWEEERWAYEIERAKKKAAQAERKAAGLSYYIRDLEPEHWEHRPPEEYEPYLPKGDKWKEKYDEPEPPDMEGLPELPEGWCWVTVQQLAEVQTGATPLRSNEAYYRNGTIPWVKSGALNQASVDEAEECITSLALEETSVKLFPAGSLLVAMYGEGQTRGKVSELKIQATTNQACAALIFRDIAETTKPFVKVFFRKNYEAIRRESSGGVQPNLNLTKIRTTVVPFPPLVEQERIVEEVERRLSVVQALERSVEANLARAQRLRQAILKKAFQGRLVDQDPDDEPASELLECIEGGGTDGDGKTPRQMALL